MKKVLSLVLVVGLVLSFTACGSLARNNAEDDGQPSEASKKLDTADYSSWTKTDWENATDEQKTEVVENVFLELGEYAMEGYAEKYEEAKKDSKQSKELNKAVENMKETVEQYFYEYPEKTLGEMVQGSKESIDSEDLIK